MTAPPRQGLLQSLAALAALAVALHAAPLRGEALASWSVVATGPPWSQADAPPTNPLADHDPVVLELPEALHTRASGGAAWSPLLGLGEPVGLASWPTLTWPPAALAYRSLPPWTATAVLSFLNVLGGGVASLLWLRWRGHGPRAALLGALAYELSPFFSAWLARPWITHLMPWAALALWAAEALGRRPGPRPAAAIGVAIGAALLGGFPQLALLVAALVPVVAAAAATGSRARAQAVALALLALALGAALAGARLVPLAAIVDATSREAIPWPEWFERTARVGPDVLVGLAVPDWGGHPLRARLPEGRSFYDNPQELRLYLGLPALALALAGAPRGGVRVFAVAALVAVVLALPTPLAWPLWALFPGFKGTSPTRVLWLLHVLAPPLVAAGAGALLREPRTPLRVTGFLAGALGLLCLATALLRPGALRGAPAVGLLCGATLGPLLLAVATLGLVALARRRPRLAAALLAGVLAWDLLHEAHAYTGSSPPAAFYPETPAIRAAAALAGRDRVLIDAAGRETVLAPFGVRTVGSYGSLHSARLVVLLDALGSTSAWRQLVIANRVPAPWRDALSARATLAAPGVRPRSPDGLTLAHRGEDAWVWSSPSALPRARLHAPDAVVEVLDRDAALRAALDPALDPRAHVIVETGRVGAIPPAPPAPTPVEVLRDEAEVVALRVSAPRGGVLVLADAWAPGWTCATAGGEDLPVLPADVALRGVPLAPGFDGEVVFRYAPPRARAGLLTTLGAAVLLAVAACLGRRGSVP